MKSTRLRGIARAYLMSISFWFGISLLMGWQYRLINQQNLWPSFADILMLAGARGLTLALWTPPILYLIGKYLSFSGNRIRYALLWSLGAVPFVVLQTGIQLLLMPPYDDVQHRYMARSLHSWLEMIRTGFADQTFIYFAIVAAAHAYQYFQRARSQALEASEFQRALAVSELQALKMQLHPHFLFNTLHGISSLIDSDPARARAMIVKLSSLLRAALQQTDSDLIPLREELKFVEEYLDLEKMRLGARLTTNLRIHPDTLPLLLPQLVLQPLVENAIRHGIGSSREHGWIEITSTRKDEVFEIQVRNSVGNKRPSGTGVGLRNTEARLQYLYSKEASFSFGFENDGNAVATLVLPALGDSRQPHEGAVPDQVEAEVRSHAGVDHR
jgi:two-component system LytT family sensor kinase